MNNNTMKDTLNPGNSITPPQKIEPKSQPIPNPISEELLHLNSCNIYLSFLDRHFEKSYIVQNEEPGFKIMLNQLISNKTSSYPKSFIDEFKNRLFYMRCEVFKMFMTMYFFFHASLYTGFYTLDVRPSRYMKYVAPLIMVSSLSFIVYHDIGYYGYCDQNRRLVDQSCWGEDHWLEGVYPQEQKREFDINDF